MFYGVLDYALRFKLRSQNDEVQFPVVQDLFRQCYTISKSIKAIPQAHLASHNFHVLMIYDWHASLSTTFVGII